MEVLIGPTRISLIRGDLTEQRMDAIVNAANSQLAGGGGVDGAIHRAGGPSIMADCRSIGSCPTGQAVRTSAGDLGAEHVIHAVGPRWMGGDRGEAELLASAYRVSLDIAAEHGAKTVAFPSISTGVYGFPIGAAAQIALSTVRDTAPARGFDEVCFVLFSEADLAVYERALEALDPP